jgi:hypothetical protein
VEHFFAVTVTIQVVTTSQLPNWAIEKFCIDVKNVVICTFEAKSQHSKTFA